MNNLQLEILNNQRILFMSLYGMERCKLFKSRGIMKILLDQANEIEELLVENKFALEGKTE